MDLLNRALISVSGADRLDLLQRLVTQDLSPLASAPIAQGLYTLLLTPQGRYAFDFFVVADGENLFLDVAAHQAEQLVVTLDKYRLRLAVAFTRVAPASLEIAFEKSTAPALVTYQDPRHTSLGWRIWRAIERFSESDSPAMYKKVLTQHGIVEPSAELQQGVALPLEYGLQNANAISFTKGCFMGQELTARTHHKGLIKHKIIVVDCDELCAANTPVTNKNGDVIGVVVRSAPPVALLQVRNTVDENSGILIHSVTRATRET